MDLTTIRKTFVTQQDIVGEWILNFRTWLSSYYCNPQFWQFQKPCSD